MKFKARLIVLVALLSFSAHAPAQAEAAPDYLADKPKP